ncbi:hypothetical protein CHLRE_01g010450v5 [Chlamydomonas reinhardtii]|uniref:WW domain-containing protein n=1 Tax=Chlamydomonas reinhardtii TaxID=3055 RepID=A0A2K3E5D0_CHLRE|nr:uncharacterized protein CHLRE_01g010450v5 [Chlamydomonas reinhardtii]PNW88005.1 hypothetical protein CHLRE_01g010450v5 [Chlamydomonas reinhardtii]
MKSRRAAAVFVLAIIACSALLAAGAPADSKDAKPKRKNLPTKAFIHEGKHWTVHKTSEGRAFFYNVESGATQWTDPRVEQMTPQQRIVVIAMFATPFVLMIAGGAAYILWVRSKHPELLKGPKKVKGLKNWERALQPPKVAKPRGRSSSPPPEDAVKRGALPAAAAEEKKDQ